MLILLLYIFIVSWWNTQIMGICIKRLWSIRRIRRCFLSLKYGTCWSKSSAVSKLCTLSILCIEISSQPISLWTKIGLVSSVIWMFRSLRIAMDWTIHRQAHHIMQVPKCGEMSLMTSRATYGLSVASSMRWSLLSHLSRQKICKVCSSQCSRASTRDCQSSTLKIWTPWSRWCST